MEDIDTDVRSFYFYNPRSTTFYIKTDNSLWGFGRGGFGVLGDGTGLDREEPVKILENVAWIGSIYEHYDTIYAIKTDRTLWKWGGNQNFAPVKVAEDIVKLLNWDHALTNDGVIINFMSDDFSPWFPSKPVYDYCNNYNRLYIDSDRNLYKRGVEMRGLTSVVGVSSFIANNVEKFFGSSHFVRPDGSLWGYGDNSRGQLGDGTKVPRDEPVHIADNVVYARAHAFLKQDGTLWGWDENNPTPRQLFDNVDTVAGNYIYFRNGGLAVPMSRGISLVTLTEWIRSGANSDSLSEFDNVKIPRTITFD
jgi:hypothetical protein